jgi:membrane-associated phospholipid phosphatase
VHAITDFADLGLLLPLAGLVALALAAVDRRRDALAWTLAVTGTFATMLVLKLAVLAWVGPDAGDGLANPSGHTAAGTVVYAGLLTLVGERFGRRMPIALLAGVGFGLIFGLSRLMLRVHTLADVLVGGAVGVAGALVLARLASPRRPEAPAHGRVIVAAVALFGVLTFHGQSLYAEPELQRIAAHIRSASERYLPL